MLQNRILKYMTFSKRTSSANNIFKLLKFSKFLIYTNLIWKSLFISIMPISCCFLLITFFQNYTAYIRDSGTYGSRARCGSFDDGIWLAWYFLNTIVTDETFSAIFLQSHQQHHAAQEVALTVRSMLLKRKFRHFLLLKIFILLKMLTLVK